MTYRTLDPAQISATAEKLEARIADRFPDSGLRKVAADLTALSRETGARAAALSAPLIWLRVAIVGAIMVGALIFLYIGTIVPLRRLSVDAFGSVQSVEAGLNTLILAGIGFFTLASLETRIKRRQVLHELHALRSLIHVIDMHQLTKDPAALEASHHPTAHSPARNYTAPELGRYLDYCSEMIAVTGKLAALYGQAVNDEGVIEAVSDIESLGGNLSRKIWQKITLLENSPDLKKKAAPKGAATSSAKRTG
jgi:hypothetical protein